MPPRNKKKSKKSPTKTPIPKRKQIEDENGWTHIIGPHQQKVRESIDTNIVYIERNIAEMVAQHEKILMRWKESEARKFLAEHVEKFAGEVKINKVICLGLGTMQNGNLTQQNNRHAQLAALVDLVDVLGGPAELTVIAQDPVFGPCDDDLLESLGIRVVESPVGFEAIDGESLVYAVHCHEEIYEEVAKRQRPAILIGNDLEELCDSREVSEWLQPFMNDYRDTSMEPVLPKRKEQVDNFHMIFYSAFYATRLYLRKSSEPKESQQDGATSEPKESQQDVATSLESESPQLKNKGGAISLERQGEASDGIGQIGQDGGSPDEEKNGALTGGEPRNGDFEIFEDPEDASRDATPEPSQDIDNSQQEDSDFEDEDEEDFETEDKENCPPEGSEQVLDDPSAEVPEHLQELVEEYESEHREPLANRRSYIHNWLPGLQLNTLPTFNHPNSAFTFTWPQSPITPSSPLPLA